LISAIAGKSQGSATHQTATSRSPASNTKKRMASNSFLCEIPSGQIRSASQASQLSRRCQYRHGDPRNAGHIPRLVAQLNLPHMGCAPTMHAARSAGNPAVVHAAPMATPPCLLLD
jgi:hypothetical protein